MDLSKTAKKKRDAVESPLFDVEQALHDLEEIRMRIDAAVKVWPETGRTLKPALKKHEQLQEQLDALKESLSALWDAGFARKWK